MEQIHADLIGLIKPATPAKEYKYLLNIVEDHSRYIIVIPLRAKKDAGAALITAINQMEVATNLCLSKIQPDWDGEFRNKELEEELNQRGIMLKPTIPNYSETNAIIERVNRTILEMCRTALISAGLPKGLWDKASDTIAYTKNRVPHRTLLGKTPVEIFLKKNPVSERTNLWPFGQKVICYDYDIADKLSPRSYEARIIGYTQTFGMYQVRRSDGSYKLAKSPKPIIDYDSESEDSDLESRVEEDDATLREEQPEEILVPDTPEAPGNAPRKRKKDAAYWDAKLGPRKSARGLVPCKIFAVGVDPDHPTNIQARASPQAEEWAKARERERDQLIKYGVYTKVQQSDITIGTKVVDTKWIYIVKHRPDGTIEKYKARKVGRGFSQEEGVSYDTDQTFAQMMRPETFKIFLVIALHRNWAIRQ